MHDDQSTISTARDIYQNVQHNSASRHGNALFQSTTQSSITSDSLRERSSTRQRNVMEASFRSSIQTLDSYACAPQQTGTSSMGHRLIHVYAPEEEYGIDVDRDEMRRLATGQDSDEEENFVGNSFRTLDGTSVGSSRQGGESTETKSVTKSTMIYHDETLTKEDWARMRFHDKWSSPAVQRFVFLLGMGLILITCLGFTFFKMHNRIDEDWVEPNKNAYLNEGIDWAPGPDAPPRFMGATVDPLIEKNIVNWALGTLRVSSEASIDGYGSISMSKVALSKDVPLFFGMQYSGANMVDMLLGQCLHLIQASNADLTGLITENDQISMIWANGRRYVNVDTTTTTGIDRAFSLGLVTSGVADVIYSPLLHDVASLFSPKHQARMFVMMRHPVEAQFARFRYLRSINSKDVPERLDELRKMSYTEFAFSDLVDDNWMTRSLVHKMYGEVLTPHDVETAKEILRRKAIIGLYDQPYISFRKFARFFHWDQLRTGGFFTENTEKCFKESIEVTKSKDELLGTLNLNEEEMKEGSRAWKKILETNRFDYELYMYGQNLYKYQLGLS